MSCMSTCLKDCLSYRTMCDTGMHVSMEDRSYMRVCLMGGLVLLKGMCY